MNLLESIEKYAKLSTNFYQFGDIVEENDQYLFAILHNEQILDSLIPFLPVEKMHNILTKNHVSLEELVYYLRNK